MSYYVTNENSVLNINNAHLRVSGNVITDVMKLGAIEFAPPASNVGGTVNFTNVTTGVTTSSNLSVGGTLSLGTVEVVATTHTLANTTANGNVTPHTVQFSNATTGIVTTANVEVGGELAVSGNVAVGTNKLFVDTVGGTVGIGSTLIDITDNTLSGAGNGLYIHNPVQGGHLLTLGTQRPWVFEQGLSDASTQLCLRSLNSGKKFNIQSPDHSNVMTIVATNGGGNVGIGTDSPDNALHIRNAIPAVLLDDSDDDTKVRITGGAGGDLYVDSNWGGSGNTGDIIFREASSEKMRITGSGNVGIGTTSPSSVFNTYGGSLWDGSSMTSKVCATLQVGRGGGSGAAANDTGFGGILEFRHHSDSRFVTIESVSEAVYSASIGLRFKTHGGAADGERMRIAGNGNVGIGTTSPACPFHVKFSTNAARSSGTRFEDANTTNYWENWINNGDYFYFAYNGSDRGWIQGPNGPAATKMPNFTGQHMTFIKDIPFIRATGCEGLIVSSDQNKYIKMNEGIEAGSNAITINESLPVVSLSNVTNDKKCFGVVSASEDPETRTVLYGAWGSVAEKEKGDTRVYINSVGEGAIWVTDINGSLESGDYITTSNVVGYGQKQDDDILHNYTVAKITMDCDFEPMTEPVQIIKKEMGDVNYWVKTTYENVTEEEYSNLIDENRQIVEGDYQKITIEESKTEQEGYELDVRQELVNILDEHGQIQWEDHPTETEKAYKIRYLDANGNITDETNAVHKAAFVGCTYHCG